MASKFSSFFAELKRRKVYHVAAVYAAVGAAISLAVPDLFSAFDLPNSAARLVIILIVLGFPIALILAWAYEVKPEEGRPGEASAEEATPDLAARPTEDPRPSVAVLPFANLSAEPDSEYFSDGITFDIINHLAKITDLKVISRTSVMRYRTTDKPLRQVGEELGVTKIVEGEVQRVGDRVRISAQLVDARSDEHLWAEQYDRELLDVFAIQSDVAQQVAVALKATLTSRERKRIERRPTDDFEAYNHYLKGRYFWERRGEGLTKGLDHFERALAIDPEYALAHAGVADCYCLLGFYGYIPPWEARAKAKAAALRALEIDEGLGEAHTSLAFVGVCYDWDMQAAERNFKRAIELNPGYAPAYYWYATLFLALERFEDAFSQNERALEVDPLSIFATVHYGWVLVMARQFERAREQLNRALELDPNFALPYWLLGLADGMESRFDEGIANLQKALGLSANYSWFLAHLGWVYGLSGRTDEARGVLSELEAQRREGYLRAVYFASVYAGLNERDEALDWLERAYEERDILMAWLNIDGTFDALRSEPRFIALLKKIGIA